MNNEDNKANLKSFFIKLVAITISIIIIINMTYNLIFAEFCFTIKQKLIVGIVIEQ